jgi:NADPH:quinone reductase-like Zn-dependent oxidoreductase
MPGGTLAPGGSLTTLGYAAGRKTTIDVADLIWKRTTIKSFTLFAQPPAAWEEVWKAIVQVLQSGGIKPIVARTFPLVEADDALRYLIETRPFGRVSSPSDGFDSLLRREGKRKSGNRSKSLCTGTSIDDLR